MGGTRFTCPVMCRRKCRRILRDESISSAPVCRTWWPHVLRPYRVVKLQYHASSWRGLFKRWEHSGVEFPWQARRRSGSHCAWVADLGAAPQTGVPDPFLHSRSHIPISESLSAHVLIAPQFLSTTPHIISADPRSCNYYHFIIFAPPIPVIFPVVDKRYIQVFLLMSRPEVIQTVVLSMRCPILLGSLCPFLVSRCHMR